MSNYDPNELGGVKYSIREIEMEREFERRKQIIINEFNKIDKDSNSYITIDEWLDFLRKKVWIKCIIEFGVL